MHHHHHHKNQTQTIVVTPTAAKHIQKTIEKRGSGVGLRLSIKNSGCSGLSYNLEFVDQAQPEDVCFPINERLALFVERKSLLLVSGSSIDYVTEGLNKKIKITNPNEVGSCGCGKSFAVNLPTDI